MPFRDVFTKRLSAFLIGSGNLLVACTPRELLLYQPKESSIFLLKHLLQWTLSKCKLGLS